MESAPALKHCPCCDRSRSAEEFSPDRRNKDGLNYKCKSCAAQYVRMNRVINPESYRAAVRKYRENLVHQT